MELNTINHNNDVQKIFEATVAGFEKTMLNFPWENEKAYAEWIAQTYYLVRHTTRLLSLAAAYTPLDQRELHYMFIEHLSEEEHHDLFLQKDLKSMNCNLNDFQEMTATQLIHQTQYYWIAQQNVCGLLGYALLLEGVSAIFGPKIYPRVLNAYGTKGTTFIKLHVEVDQGHYAEGLKLLQQIKSSDIPAVMDNLKQSAFLYQKMYSEIMSKYGLDYSKNQKAA